MLLSLNIPSCDSIHPAFDVSNEKLSFPTYVFSTACKHTCLPKVLAVGKWDHDGVGRLHILENKIHSNGNPLVLGTKLVAEAETAGFKGNIRRKPGLPALVEDDVMNLEFTGFNIQPLPL